MKALFLAIPLCMALLTSCAHAPVTAAPAAPEGEPLIADTEKLESVIYRDFDETWYVINTGDRGFSQVETALSQLHGEPCDDPALTGCYDFSFTMGDTTHDLGLTSGSGKSYVYLDGQWYQNESDTQIEQSLVKLLLRKGEPIPKEQWIHNPDYVSLGILLRNNKGLASTQQTICYADAPYEYTDGMLLFEPKDLTKTELIDPHGRSVRVYGDGTPDTRVSRLIFTLPGGAYCQIVAFHTVDPDDVMAILRCLIDKGFEPDDYAQIPDAESGYSS